jgi:hypothetical protein
LHRIGKAHVCTATPLISATTLLPHGPRPYLV